MGRLVAPFPFWHIDMRMTPLGRPKSKPLKKIVINAHRKFFNLPFFTNLNVIGFTTKRIQAFYLFGYKLAG